MKRTWAERETERRTNRRNRRQGDDGGLLGLIDCDEPLYLLTIAELLSPLDYRNLRTSHRSLDEALSGRQNLQTAEHDTQRVCLTCLVDRRNVFLTGAAGTGKSHTLCALIELAEKRDLKVAVTATTGLAATHLPDGRTIHSFSMLGLADQDVKQVRDVLHAWTNREIRFPKPMDKDRLWFSGEALQRWRDVDLLIVDEVSMMNSNLLELLEMLARTYRARSPKKLLVVFCGDFYQLGAVQDDNASGLLAFDTRAWERLQFRTCELTVSVRHLHDPAFGQALHELRQGIVTKKSQDLVMSRVVTDPALLKELRGRPADAAGFRPVELYPTHAKVRFHTDSIVKRLFSDVTADVPSSAAYYEVSVRTRTVVNGHVEESWLIHPNARTPYSAVVAAAAAPGRDSPDFPSRKILAATAKRNVPPVLEFKPGMQYYLTTNVCTKEKLVNGASCVYRGAGKFDFARGALGVDMFPPACLLVVPIQDGVRVELWQRPYKLGYAASIHGSQGMTLDRVTLDLRNVFASGQAYTGLSRCRTLDGITVLGRFNVKAACAPDPRVARFYRDEKAKKNSF